MHCDAQNRESIACLQDRLTGALIGLARATEGNEAFITENTDFLVAQALSVAAPGESDTETLITLLHRIGEEKRRLVPDCFSCGMPCGRNADVSMQDVWDADDETRALRTVILFGARSIAGHVMAAAAHGIRNETVNRFLYKALYALGAPWSKETLLALIPELGEMQFACMKLTEPLPTGRKADL